MSLLGKVTRVVLFLLAALFVFKGVAFAFSLPIPGAGEGGPMARRLAAAELGGAGVLLLCGLRLRADARWIHPALALVAFNWLASMNEVVLHGSREALPPLIPETLLLALFSAHALASRGAS